MERKVKKEIRALLKELGASVATKGFNYAIEVICDGVINDTPIIKGSKLCANWAPILGDSYVNAHWAPVFGDTYARTERALRFVKDTCVLKSGNTPKFTEVFGISSDDCKLHLYDFLESIRIYISEEMGVMECSE